MTRRSSPASRTASRVSVMSCSATWRLPSSRCASARTKRFVSAEVAVATSAATFACVTDASRTNPLKSGNDVVRSEEHTSELQSRLHLVCRLLLEKKKKKRRTQKKKIQNESKQMIAQ